jgi:hypothetical protein
MRIQDKLLYCLRGRGRRIKSVKIKALHQDDKSAENEVRVFRHMMEFLTFLKLMHNYYQRSAGIWGKELCKVFGIAKSNT